MIRKTIIVLLTFMVLLSGVLFVLSGYWLSAWQSGKHHRFTANAPTSDQIVGPGRLTGVIMTCGEIVFYTQDVARYTGEDSVRWTWTKAQCTDHGLFPQPTYRSDERSLFIAIPFWLLMFIFAAYPTIAFIRGPLRRWRRRRKGLYPSCGYDLTGNESAKCPEGTEEVDSM